MGGRVGADKFAAVSAPIAFFFPCCTYSIFPLLVSSRQEHSVATWRERGKETWCKIHLCTNVSES